MHDSMSKTEWKKRVWIKKKRRLKCFFFFVLSLSRARSLSLARFVCNCEPMVENSRRRCEMCGIMCVVKSEYRKVARRIFKKSRIWISFISTWNRAFNARNSLLWQWTQLKLFTVFFFVVVVFFLFFAFFSFFCCVFVWIVCTCEWDVTK